MNASSTYASVRALCMHLLNTLYLILALTPGHLPIHHLRPSRLSRILLLLPGYLVAIAATDCELV